MSRTSLHRRITADLAAPIRSGAWPPGHRIPFEHELMQRYGCARATANKAVQALATQGLVERRRKAGTFVARPHIHTAILRIPDIQAEIEARGQSYGWRLLGRLIRTRRPSVEERELAVTGSVLELEGLHLAGVTPFALEHRLINLGEAPAAAAGDFVTEAPGAWLLAHAPWTEARHEIAAVNPSPAEAATLAIDVGCACLSVKRWTWRREAGVTFARQLFTGGAIDLEARFAPGEV